MPTRETASICSLVKGPGYKTPSIRRLGKIPGSLGQISKLAADEARHLHHDLVGSDHLLLALLHPECPGAAREVLASFDVSLQEARNALVESLGDPFEDRSHGWVTMPRPPS